MEVAQIWREHYCRKKMYSCLASYVFQRVQIITVKNYNRKKIVQSSDWLRRLRFGGNITTEKKIYSRLAGYVFWWVQITTGKITTRQKGTVVWPSFGNWKKLRPEKS
jgi:hypothetical protein